jgi:hypothetical protein
METFGTAVEPQIQQIPQEGVNSQWEQSTEVKVIPQEDYKSLQSEYTRNRQVLFDTSLKLAKGNPQEILDISDKKIQSSVIKELYWVDDISELKMVYWERFWETDSEKELSDLEKLTKEVNLLKFKDKKSSLDWEILKFKLSNPHLFVNWNEEEVLKEKLNYISKDIPLNEAIEMASIITFWKDYKNPNSVYKELGSSVQINTTSSKAPIKAKEKENNISQL